MGEVVSIITHQPIITHDEVGRITSASFRKSARSGEFSIENVRHIAATYGQVPAWVAENPHINKAVTMLRKYGWKVECWAHPKKILCSHPDVSGEVDIVTAQKMQGIVNQVRGNLS